MWNNIKDAIRRMQRFASTPFRTVVILTAILLVIGWLMGYLRPLDALLGVELPAWIQVPGMVAVVAGAALGLTCGAMLSTRGIAIFAETSRLQRFREPSLTHNCTPRSCFGSPPARSA
jgi:hypothetical protein